MEIAFRRLTATFVLALSLTPVAAPAQIVPLVPGVVVEELPVRLTNVNNLRFTPDDRLSALTYNGRVYLLEDADGDGLEDTAQPYWDQPTIRVPVGMAWSGRNLYVSSHGKLSLLHDADGDSRAEREEIVSQGWPPTDVASGGVDATAVTLDGAGNVYFGLMCADYSNPYRVHEGRSAYDRNSLRGTILKLSPDHSRREVVCTGIRVPYALAFNRLGDLFVTDQEGETWLPGGNPLDELNQVVPGRHYGFPPRDAKYVPEVVDEPPVVSFGPQHQSACGLAFNDHSLGHDVFGPAWWEGNAFVAGLSRGRLWRVPLVKTPHGYVGKPVTIAISSLLLTDVAVSPRGELYVSCHSGPPDWGAGPEAAGRLFRLRYAAQEQPQPVFAYPLGSLEVAVAFDQPLDPSAAASKAGISYGQHVRSADRLETLKPPYAAVEAQARAHRGQLGVVSAELSADRRVLLLKTAPHPVRGVYALTIPGVKGERADDDATIDLDYDLSGVQATWTPQDAAAPAWQGWFPHVDTEVARALCMGSNEHQRLFELWKTPGSLELEGQLVLPPGEITLRLDSSLPCTICWGETKQVSSPTGAGRHSAELVVQSPDSPRSLAIRIEADGVAPLAAHLSYASRESGPRPIDVQRLWVPWAPPELPANAVEIATGTQSASGDARRGKDLFFGQTGRCSSCHALHGEGARFAPDLSNLLHRDRKSILRDLREPSAAVNPDYLGYQIVLRDGRLIAGTIRAENSGVLRIVDNEARETVVTHEEVEQVVPLATSIMPAGLLDSFSGKDIDDLLAFLQAPPTAAGATATKAATRTTTEIEAVLHALPASPAKEPPRLVDVVLVDGVQDHGPGEHDYPAWQNQWTKILQASPALTIQKARDWPSAQQWRDAEVVVLYFWNHDWSAKRLSELDVFLARGGGVVVLHSALISDDAPEALATRFGLAAQPQRTKYRHGPTELHFGEKAKSPLVAGFSPLALTDETYWPMIGDRSKVNVLATAVEDGQEWPMLWTFEAGKGRVFASILGHYSATYDDPLFQILLLRGIAWAGNEPLGRLQGLGRSDRK